MLRTVVILAAIGALAAPLAAGSPASSAKHFPEVIQLPSGFRPEGIEVGRGTTFYTGRSPTARSTAATSAPAPARS